MHIKGQDRPYKPNGLQGPHRTLLALHWHAGQAHMNSHEYTHASSAPNSIDMQVVNQFHAAKSHSRPPVVGEEQRVGTLALN